MQIDINSALGPVDGVLDFACIYVTCNMYAKKCAIADLIDA